MRSSAGAIGSSRVRRAWVAVVTTTLVAGASACVVVPPPPPGPVHPPRPLRIAYFGDSIGYTLGGWYTGIETTATAVGDITYVPAFSRVGCAINRYSLAEPTAWNPTGTYNPLCDWSQDVYFDNRDYLSAAHAIASAAPIDFAVLVFCGWDWPPRRIPLPGGGWDPLYRPLGDPVYDAYVLSELRALVDTLLGAGAAEVMMLTCALPMLAPDYVQPQALAWQVTEWNAFVRAVPDHDPRVRVVELAPWVDAQPDVLTYRWEGQHYSEAGTDLVHERYLDRQYILLSQQLFGS